MNEFPLERVRLPKGTGWILDPIDARDKAYHVDVSASIPLSIDLREWCPPIEDQGQVNSCTTHAAIALVEYYEKRAHGQYLDASRLFLYKVTRNLLHETGNVATFARTTMKALAICGVPPEEYWPYDEAKLDEEPPAFCYALAARYRAIDYYRIDIKDRRRDLVLQHIKVSLAAHRPAMFGMLFYQGCLDQSQQTGQIPIPSDSDAQWVGHNMAAVGYDDTITIKNTDPTGIETMGALLIRNSWGTEWGESGYGWLPYEYVLRPLSVDWWIMQKQEWLDTGVFDPKK